MGTSCRVVGCLSSARMSGVQPTCVETWYVSWDALTVGGTTRSDYMVSDGFRCIVLAVSVLTMIMLCYCVRYCSL